MIVGEPSLMGDDMDDEDERFITRIENNQFSSHNSPQFSSSNYQPIPSSPSVISQKQNFPISSTTLTTNSIKREQTSFPESPKQLLPSIFSTNSTNSNMVVNSSNMENSFCETKFFSSSNNSPPNGVLNSQIQVCLELYYSFFLIENLQYRYRRIQCGIIIQLMSERRMGQQWLQKLNKKILHRL